MTRKWIGMPGRSEEDRLCRDRRASEGRGERKNREESLLCCRVALMESIHFSSLQP